MLILAFLTWALQAQASSCQQILGGEWGPLSAVVLGNPRGARFPDEVPAMLRATLPHDTLAEVIKKAGQPFPAEIVDRAASEIAALKDRLGQLGVAVLQPQTNAESFSEPIVTEHFKSRSGLYAAMPRDLLLLLPPNLVVVAPMAWRSRHREAQAYAAVLHELEGMGLKVVVAPRPKLSKLSYVNDWEDYDTGPLRPVVSEEEPLFDAADFLRFGDHIIGQLSHVTNKKGVAWIRQILDPKYRLHIIEFNDPHAMHIDATLLPLRRGELLVNPVRVPVELEKLLSRTLFKHWRIVVAPPPSEKPRSAPLYFTSRWINMNMLVGPGWALVEEKDDEMKALLKSRHIEAVPCPLQHFQALGGSTHCATLDIRPFSPSGLDAAGDLHIYRDPVSGSYRSEGLGDFLAR